MNRHPNPEKDKQSHDFYTRILGLLRESGERFMIGGAFAVSHYTGIWRDTKDLDVFTDKESSMALLRFFSTRGYRTELTDMRWLGKVFDGDYFIDLIFDTPNNICKIDDSWFDAAEDGVLFDEKVRFISPEDLIWCKSYVQNRLRYDGADVHHVILRQGERIDWRRLLGRLDQHWHLLFSSLILFQFIYPADYRRLIPRWLFDALLARATEQYDLPAAVRPVCLGPLIDQHQYVTDIREWGYKVIQV